ncbi:hypothetical protein IPJ91_02260 [bacterium]|nr:MAG: hypothetical protein IPJ91_02260 [bacterium]
MQPKWKLVEKIETKVKTIETRFYKLKAKPWNLVKVGESIFFKESGKSIYLKAKVLKVEQYENLDLASSLKLIATAGKANIGITSKEMEIIMEAHLTGKKYAILIWLTEVEKVEPFNISKAGFGAMASWICVENIEKVKILI